MESKPAAKAQEVSKEGADKRFEVRARVEYQTFSVRGEGLLWDISGSGARIEKASRPMPPGRKLHLELPFFPDSAPVVLSAEVVRTTASGFAVKFLHLNDRLKKLLEVVLPQAVAFRETE